MHIHCNQLHFSKCVSDGILNEPYWYDKICTNCYAVTWNRLTQLYSFSLTIKRQLFNEILVFLRALSIFVFLFPGVTLYVYRDSRFYFWRYWIEVTRIWMNQVFRLWFEKVHLTYKKRTISPNLLCAVSAHAQQFRKQFPLAGAGTQTFDVSNCPSLRVVLPYLTHVAYNNLAVSSSRPPVHKFELRPSLLVSPFTDFRSSRRTPVPDARSNLPSVLVYHRRATPSNPAAVILISSLHCPE